MEENFDCTCCGQDLRLPPNTFDVLAHVVERAERIEEGEDWNLAEYLRSKFPIQFLTELQEAI